MKIYIEKLLAEIKNKPQVFFIGTCVFFVATMGTSVKDVASTGFALMFLSSLLLIRQWKTIWKKLSDNEKWLLLGFGLYALSGVIAVINVQDVQQYVKELERYMRFLVAVPIYLLVKNYKADVISYLYVGAIVSGPFLLLVALQSYLENPNVPAQGYYHHIIFGGAAMLNVGVMLSILLTKKLNNLNKVIILFAMLCGLSAALLSQSRGVWLVLPFYVFFTIYYSLKHSRISAGGYVISLVLIAGVVLLSPLSEMIKERVGAGVKEVSAYYDDDQYITSVGTRLAMWSIAIDVWKQHPVVGSGPGDFDDIVRDLQNNGEYTGMDIHASTHNIYFQSLVNAGLIGFMAMLFAIFLMPLKVVGGAIDKNPAVSLLGVFFILLFATLGFSESWTSRLPVVSVYIIYFIVIFSNLCASNNQSEDV